MQNENQRMVDSIEVERVSLFQRKDMYPHSEIDIRKEKAIEAYFKQKDKIQQDINEFIEFY